MDLHKILGELHAERLRLGTIIKELEELHPQTPRATGKRGRRHMDAAARKAVSQRMKRYWAAKKDKTAEEGPVAGELLTSSEASDTGSSE